MQYLLTFLVLVGVLLVVAIFIILIEKIMGSAGDKTITINEDMEIKVTGDTTVFKRTIR